MGELHDMYRCSSSGEFAIDFNLKLLSNAVSFLFGKQRNF